MLLKIQKPYISSRRHRIILSSKSLYKLKFFKLNKKRSSGRNNTGRITVFQRGGGHKQFVRIIDNKRNYVNTPARLVHIEQNPTKSSLVGILYYKTGIFSSILLPKHLKIGSNITSYETRPGLSYSIRYLNGNTMPLIYLPKGSILHNLENKPNTHFTCIRSGGTKGKLIQKYTNGYALIRLPTKEEKLFPLSCKATIGIVANSNHHLVQLGKAGVNRWLNQRPIVRGVAMNPIDHPHGGGGGHSKGHRQATTPWGKNSKGMKTVRKLNPYIYKKKKS